MTALHKNRAHGDSSHDVSNRWVGSQRSVPNLNACPAMVPIALSLRIARRAGGKPGRRECAEVEKRPEAQKSQKNVQATKKLRDDGPRVLASFMKEPRA